MVCTQIDSWLEDKYLMESRWEVELSDGTRVYQDDGRPGMEVQSAWERLWSHCENHCLYIIDMTLKNRSHVEHVGNGCDGFFFSRGVYGGFGNFQESYLTGILNDGILEVVKWQILTLTRVKFIDESMMQTRDANEAGVNLIRRRCVEETISVD